MKIRLFEGWDFDANTLKDNGWVKTAYAKGVPMGGDLPVSGTAKAPGFIIRLSKIQTVVNSIAYK
jgi:Protein of unknown function (DUF3604)